MKPAINKKRILLSVLGAIFLGLLSYYLWLAYIFFPADFEITRKEALETGEAQKPQVIAFSLIELIDSACLTGYHYEKINILAKALNDKGYLVKDDPFVTASRSNFCFRAGTGYPGIWVDERSSILIPDNAKISYDLQMGDFPSLEFSALSVLTDGIIDIDISSSGGNKTNHSFTINEYKIKYSSKDVAIKWNNIGYDKAKEDTGWKDFQLDLSQFAGMRIFINIAFKPDKGKTGALFIANPRIFRQAVKKRYNVIYLIFDGVSTRHFSFYNHRSKLTPFMKEVAEREFIVFDNMFTLGNKTRISTAGLFSSVLPYDTRHGINRNFIPENEKENYYRLVRSGSLASLPDVYSKNGYITEQFGNSGFTVHLNSIGVDYGFERSYEFSCNPYDSYGISHNLFKFFRKNNSREFFLYLHYNTPHKPFYAPVNYFIKGIFDAPAECLWRPDFMGCIRYTDDVFNNIYLALKTNNLLENTIIVVATDHGAGYDIKKYDRGFLYNDYARMAFMLRLPEELKRKLNIDIAKKRIDTYISSINTAPTLLDLCGIDKPAGFRGSTFTGVLNGRYKNKFFDKEIWCFDRKAAMLLTDDLYKYIITFPDAKRLVQRKYLLWGDQKEIPFEELYDLKTDPEETHNLILDKRDILKKYRILYKEKDIHHPEKTVLAFFNDGKQADIEVGVVCASKIRASLYSTALKESDGLKIHRNATGARFIFIVNNDPLYLVFENKDDRSPLSISIKSDGKPLDASQIYSTYLNMNIFQNPIIIKNKEDFILLNDIRLPAADEIMYRKKGLSVKISRIDLHRWIDMGDLETACISAGMKETLKSWGYIQ